MDALALRHRFENLVLSAGMIFARHALLSPMLRAAAKPSAAQHSVLRRILAANAGTSFGLEHTFGRIRDAADWRKAVPIQSFDDLYPWITRQSETGEPCLTAEPPVMYNMTSGTTSRPKLVPITRSGVRRIAREQRLFACALHGYKPRLFAGRLAGIGGSAIEGKLPSGVPYGSASGMIYREMPAALRARYVIPPEVFDISDYETRYRVIATFLLSAEDVTFATTANPSTFLRLLSVINGNLDAILSDVAGAHLSLDTGLGKVERESLLASLTRQPGRAAELARLASRGELRFTDVWPQLRGIAVWAGGSCGIALEALRKKLDPAVKVMEIGYVASEFRGTINVDPHRNLCLPTLTDVFFEFVEAESWEEGNRSTLGLEELEYQKQYRVIATTGDGFYRYDIGDIVKVAGRIGQTPALAFVQKGRGVTSITGEKIHESQMSDAVSMACVELGTHPNFYLALADEAASSYRIYLELSSTRVDSTALSLCIDRLLASSNVEYRAKRDSKRLLGPEVVQLRSGAAEDYRRHCILAGQRDGQFKVMPLRYAREVNFDFAQWRADA